MTTLVRAADLSCERDDRVLFQNLSFEVSTGEVLHLKGANGVGKTTLIRRLVGLSWVVEGDVKWHESLTENGHSLDGSHHWYMAHRPAVTLQQTPFENLQFALALHNQTFDDDVLWSALDEVGLRGYEDVPSSSLSAGQQRRVSLSRLYVECADIKLWILDEPFTALDVDAVQKLEQRIQAFVEQGGSVIMTSHHGLNDASVRVLALGES